MDPHRSDAACETVHDSARRHLGMTRELLEILDLFAANDIPALPYKGPLLAAAEYGGLARRKFCDLDILVHRAHVLRAKELLIARGYAPEYRLSPTHEAAWMRARNDINLRRSAPSVVVELHWEVLPRRFCVPFDREQFWARAQTVRLGGRDVPTLAVEDLLLVLCAHGAKHGWMRHTWIRDVAAIVTNHPELDWTAMVEHARRLGIERMLRVGLQLAKDIAGCESPEYVRGLPEDPMAARLAREVRDQLAAPARTGHSALRRTLFHLRIRERLRDKMRLALYTLIVPSDSDRLLVPLPQSAACLYYLLRPFRLVHKYMLRRAVLSSSGTIVSRQTTS